MRPCRPYFPVTLFAAFGLLACSPAGAQDAAPPPDAAAVPMPAPDAVTIPPEVATPPPAPVAPAPPVPAAPVYDKRVVPPWANSVEPVDPTNHADYDPSLGDLPDGGGRLSDNGGAEFGPSNGMQVNLATGSEEYVPDSDLKGYNQIGTSAFFRRAYYSSRALTGYGSPGLSAGWVHNYDVTLTATSPTTWGALILHHAKGCNELVKPLLDAAGQPTGKFDTGMPCDVVGRPGTAPGQWQGLSLTWRDQTHWLFLPAGDGSYLLGGVTNVVGNGFLLQWDGARRLRGAVDSQDRKPLLTLAYDASGNLSDVKNSLGDTIHYRFGATPGQPGASLLAVSTLLTAAAPNGLSRYVFTYAVGGNRTLLKTISVPDPGGPGRSISTIQYLGGKVVAHVDAEGNRHVMTYGDGHTLVQIAGPDGKVVSSWVQKYDAHGPRHGQHPVGPMFPFLLKRLALALVSVWAVCTLTFFIAASAPGDPALIAAGEKATPAAIALARHDLGLDKPVLTRYGLYSSRCRARGSGPLVPARPGAGLALPEARPAEHDPAGRLGHSAGSDRRHSDGPGRRSQAEQRSGPAADDVRSARRHAPELRPRAPS